MVYGAGAVSDVKRLLDAATPQPSMGAAAREWAEHVLARLLDAAPSPSAPTNPDELDDFEGWEGIVPPADGEDR